MTDVLILPVPEMVGAVYLVPVCMPHLDAQFLADRAVANHVAEPLRSLTRRLIGTPALTVAVRPLSAFAAQPPAGLAPGEDPALVAFATAATPQPGPVHEWVTRAAAASLAAELGLPVIDCCGQQVLDAAAALQTLPGAPRLATAEGSFRLADWVTVERDGLRLTTVGLRRFGLPELRIEGTPADLHAPWAIALVSLGGRLLGYLRRTLRGGDPTAFLVVPARQQVSRRDVAAAYAVPLRTGGAALPVRLSLDPAVRENLETYVQVNAPDDQQAAEHRRSVTTLFAQEGSVPDGAIPREGPVRSRAARRTHPPLSKTRRSGKTADPA